MTAPRYVCRNCGGTELVAWYKVDESQRITVGFDPDGGPDITYTGITDTGECYPDDSYTCQTCHASAENITDLVRVRPDPDLAHVLDQKHRDRGNDLILEAIEEGWTP